MPNYQEDSRALSGELYSRRLTSAVRESFILLKSTAFFYNYLVAQLSHVLSLP
jgi:hypothetical protein